MSPTNDIDWGAFTLFDGRGPNPRVARAFAAEKGITLPAIGIDLMAGENRAPPFLAINPEGTLPALRLPAGMVIGESVAICEYLEEASPVPARIGGTEIERAETRAWVRRISLAVCGPMVLGFRSAEGRAMFEPRMAVASEETAPELKRLAQAGLVQFDLLLRAQPFICGARFTLADILLFAFLEFGMRAGQPFEESLEGLARWYAQVAARPAIAASAKPA